MAALRSWVTFESNSPAVIESKLPSWERFFDHIDSVSTSAFPVLERTILAKCIQPLEVRSLIIRLKQQRLYDAFKGPAALMTKHNRKAIDFARYQALKAKDETPDKKLIESAKTFKSLHESLLEELPVFLSLAGEFIESIVHQFAIAQVGMT
jgi:hypothetical protein